MNHLDRLNILTKQEKISFLTVIIINWMSGIFQIFASYLFIPFVSYFTIPDFKPSTFSFLFENAIILSLCIILVQLISGYFNLFALTQRNSVIQDLIQRYSKLLLVNVIQTDFEELNFQSTGELSKKILNDADRVGMNYFGSFIDLSVGFLNMMVFIILLNTIEPIFFYIFILFIGLNFILSYFFLQRKVSNLGKQINTSVRIRFNQINEILNNVKLIKLYQTKDYFVDQFDGAATLYKDFIKNSFRMGEIPKTFVEFGMIVLIVLILMIAYLYQVNIVNLFPQLSFILLSMYRLLPTFYRLSGAYHNINLTSVIVDETFRHQSSPNIYALNQSEIAFDQSIRISDLSFKYSNRENNTLSNVYLEIKKGDIFGIVGESGSGKSTLLNLILNLYHRQNGHIYIDGIDIDTLDKEAYLDLFAYVSQETYLFNQSILFNIALKKECDHEEMDKIDTLIKMVGLDDFISNLKDGMNTNVGERGVQISGGQRQRIGIARALYKNSKIIILDEATNALDLESETILLEKIKGMIDQKTFIIISHRENTLQYCTNGIDLNFGEVQYVYTK